MTAAGRLGRDRVPLLYAIVDAAVVGLERLPQAVAVLAAEGIRWIQLRAKHVDDLELCTLLEQSLAEVAAAGRTVLWVNDRPDLAAIHGARGVHLGQEDLPPSAARNLVGEDCWIGQSTHNASQVRSAAADPAVDLIAVGPIFETQGKENPDPVVGLGLIAEARATTDKPVVAIGGIDASNVGEVLAAGADAAAMIGAFCRGDLQANCRRLRRAVGAREAGC